MGTVTFVLLRNAEIVMLKTHYQSSTSLIGVSVLQGVAKKLNAASLVNKLFQNSIGGQYGGTYPNFTFPAFESTMKSLMKVADLTFIAYSPLITPVTRKKVESNAASHVYLLKGPSSLNNSVNGNWIVANGISNKTDTGKKVRDTGLQYRQYISYLYVSNMANISYQQVC